MTIDELRAIAFDKSFLFSIISIRNACRAGISNALTMPCTIFSATIHSTVMRPVSVRAASANDSTIDTVCVIASDRRRSMLSTMIPAKGPSRNAGICPANPTRPSRSAEPVSRYTSQLVAVVVIHEPASETIWPPKNRR